MKLTEREEKILKLIASGASTAQTAVAVNLSPGTLRVYLPKIYKKIGVGNMVQAAVWWVRREMKSKAKSAIKLGRGK